MNGLFSAVNIEKLSFGQSLLVLVLGMLIILAVLSLLIGLLYVIRYCVEALDKIPKKEKKENNEKAPARQSDAPAGALDDEEVVAAITAAITVIMTQENGGNAVAPFKIKRIKHIR